MEHRIDEAREPPDLRRDRLEVLVICGKDAVLHRLDGGQGRHERGPELMGDVARKAMLKLYVVLHLARHAVEGLAEPTKLVVSREAGARREVTVPDAGGRVRDSLDRLCQGAREQIADDKGHGDGDGGRNGNGIVRAGPEGDITPGEKRIRLKGPHAHRADDGPRAGGDVCRDHRVHANRNEATHATRLPRVSARCAISILAHGIVVDQVATRVKHLNANVGERL